MNADHREPCGIDDAISEWLRRRHLGEQLSEEEFLSIYPEIAVELRAALAKLRMIDAVHRRAEQRELSDSELLADRDSSLTIRCPDCNAPNRVPAEASLAEINCNQCGSCFGLVEDGPTDLPPGARVGQFEIVERLGAGGFGVVYLAHDVQLDRNVAIKIPRRGQLSSAEAEQFLREARAAAQLRHPHIVSVYEVGRQQDVIFIVSEFVAGMSLAELLGRERFTAQEAASLCVEIARALDHAHEHGVVHRDLKPANILLDEGRQPHIADFGLARRAMGETTLTLDGQLVGTPAYMSPEQARGDSHLADRRSDVYSLGVILFELLTGELPFRGNASTVVHQIIEDVAPSPRKLNATVPRDLETICLKCLEKDPTRRYATTAELAEDLGRFLRHEPIAARPIGRLERTWRWCRRRPAIAAMAVVSITATLVLVTTLMVSNARIEQQRLAERQERQQAVANLYQSYVREARALRLAREPGYRAHVFERLRRAMALDTAERNLDELRLEASASLGDFVGLEPDVFKSFPEPISAIALGPRGRWLCVGFGSGLVLVYDVKTHAEVARLDGHHASIGALGFSPEGDTLVSADSEGMVRFWQTADGGPWRPDRTVQLNGGVWTMSRIADGRWMTVNSGGGYSVLEVSDLSESAPPVTLRAPDGEVICGVALSPDGRLLAGIYGDVKTRTVCVWDTRSGQVQHVVDPPLEFVWGLAFSCDSQSLACFCSHRIVFFSVGDYRQQTIGGTDSLLTGSFSPHGRYLAMGTNSGSRHVVLWNGTTYRELAILDHPGRRAQAGGLVTFSTDGETLAAADPDSVSVWTIAGAAEKLSLPTTTQNADSVHFSPDGSLLAFTGYPARTEFWDLTTGQPGGDQLAIPAWPIAFSEDWNFAAGAGGKTNSSGTGSVTLWDRRSARPLVATDHSDRLFAVGMSPDGRYLAASGNGLTVWQVGRGDAQSPWTLTRIAYRPGTYSPDLCFSPGGNLIAWTDRFRYLRLWDVQHGREISWGAHQLLNGWKSLMFDAQGEHVWFINAMGQPEACSVATGQRTQTLGQSGQFSMSQMSLSRDGRWLAVAEKPLMVSIWDTATGRQLLKLRQEESLISSLAFSRDGRQLAVGLSDGQVSVWRLDKVRAELATLGLDWHDDLVTTQRSSSAMAALGDIDRSDPLRWAETLRAQGLSMEAQAAVRDALKSSTTAEDGLWELWFLVSAVDLRRGPRELLADWPDTLAPAAPGDRMDQRNLLEPSAGPLKVNNTARPSSAGADLHWLLEQLVQSGIVRINCGGDEYRGHDGAIWGRDRFFLAESTYVTQQDIQGTQDEPLYQSARTAGSDRVLSDYHVPLPLGRYEVTMHFAELWWSEHHGSPGYRRFGVVAEGQCVLDDYRPPNATADIKSFQIDVEDGFLDLEFIPRYDLDAQITALEIRLLKPTYD
jgi:WD40 repeat protein